MRSADETLAIPFPGNPEHLGAWLFRQRSWLPVPLALALLAATQANPHENLIHALGLALAACGEMIRLWAVRHIGVISRTRSDRTGPLITSGPYHLVRNPIYTAMFGMLLATGLAISHWAAIVAAVLVFVVGTRLRIRTEERLLREAFGPEFETYVRNVPAVVPNLFSLTSKYDH